ncbi:MAG: Cas8a1 family CRISPR/Cas system-associated protein [Candidatus Hydrothermales bacterium]
MEKENTITFYPSNWLYNAGVIGFLRVLEELKLNKNIYLEEHIEIKLDKLNIDEIFDAWDKLTFKKLRISYKNKKGGTQRYYYANQTEDNIKKKIEAILEKSMLSEDKMKKRKKLHFSCTICGNIFYTTKSDIEVLKQTFGNILFGAERTFPNTYWMLRSGEVICPKCEFILMCHHIPFVVLGDKKEMKKGIFINTPIFKLTYDLNKFAEKILEEWEEREIKKILGSTLLQFAIKRKALLGAWTLMNIEVIIKEKDTINYFDLPYHITRILLDHEIASLIERIGEKKIFDLIIEGKFSELEKVNYFVLRGILKLKNKDKILKNDPLTNYVDDYKNTEHLKKISKNLPELYVKITKILEREENMGEKSINTLIWKLKQKGDEIKDSKVAKSIDDIAFRLLEQVRLGNKDNVFYMLLRCFKANDEKFPEDLIDVFKPENEKYFKTLIFSFLAPILGKEDKGGEV